MGKIQGGKSSPLFPYANAHGRVDSLHRLKPPIIQPSIERLLTCDIEICDSTLGPTLRVVSLVNNCG